MYKKENKNLRIRAIIQSPIIAEKFIPLDSVLYYHHCRKIHGPQLVTKSKEIIIDESLIPLLPIEKINNNSEDWYYACSFAVLPDTICEGTMFKVKHRDWYHESEYLKSDIKKVLTNAGKYKSSMPKYYFFHCKYIDWFCVGNPIAIAELLQFCRAIGKNTGDGWGQVLRWEISEWPEDWHCRGPEGRLMRAVPADGGTPYGLRPSYWNPRNIKPCQLPS